MRPGSGCGRAREQRLEHAQEALEVHGLDDVTVEAGLLGLPAIVVLTPAGERYQHHALAPWLLADAATNFVAVLAGQPDVEEHRVGQQLLSAAQRCHSVVRGVSLVAGHAEQHRKGLRTVDVVVDDEDSARAGGGCCLGAAHGLRRRRWLTAPWCGSRPKRKAPASRDAGALLLRAWQ